MCKAEVTTVDAVKGDKESNGLIENAVMLIRGIIRASRCHIESSTQEPLSDESLILPWLVGCILSRCQKSRDGKRHPKDVTRVCPANQISTDPMSRVNPRYKLGTWLGMRINSAECFNGNADGVFEVREIRRLEPQSRWDKEAVKNVRMTDGTWRVYRPEIQVDPIPIPIPPLPLEGARH